MEYDVFSATEITDTQLRSLTNRALRTTLKRIKKSATVQIIRTDATKDEWSNITMQQAQQEDDDLKLSLKWLRPRIPKLVFKHGRVNLSNEFHNGGPSTAVDNKSIDALRHMIETDRHVTYHEIQIHIKSLKIPLGNQYDHNHELKGCPQ
ncbi:hypothetical protein EVAR_21451_1 [Eumeta japonica]|uniref:Uncharacterized protein n=1 Tax=Eumeta variegata TaxID=151549 RepID=A0A4C1VJM7_EUMVA|nr:hypothetical protein EVAR_21451_1 [Eumeta japonica]